MLILRSLLSAFLITVFIGCSPPEDTTKQKTWDIRDQSLKIQAPHFILKDLDDVEVSLSDYNGKDVLLVFGATWCRICRAEIPRLKEWYSKYQEKNFELINIYIQESKEKVSSFVNKNEIPFKILLDENGNVAQLYGVRGVPTKYIISREGLVLCVACRDVDLLLGMLFNDENKM